MSPGGFRPGAGTFPGVCSRWGSVALHGRSVLLAARLPPVSASSPKIRAFRALKQFSSTWAGQLAPEIMPCHGSPPVEQPNPTQETLVFGVCVVRGYAVGISRIPIIDLGPVS